MSVPRRHHFVPRFCLAYFVDKHGRVWTYDAEADAPRDNIPDETGLERDYHTVTRENGELDTTLEAILGDLEGQAAPIYARMVQGALPQGDDRTIMAQFFAVAYVRSKRKRRTYGEGYGQMMQVLVQQTAQSEQAFADLLADMEASEGFHFTDEQRVKLRKDVADWSGYRLSIDREFTLGAFIQAEPITRLIDQMYWSLIEAKDEIYLLSDSPLVKSGAGFALPETQISLPLSPNMMWIGHWRSDLPTHSSMSRQEIMRFNRMRAAGADRYLYAPYQDAALMRFCKKYVIPRPGVQIGDGDTSKLAPVGVRRKK
jgi:hypothetical protein